MTTLAAFVAATAGILVLGGIYTALDRIATALERLAKTHERWSGDWRTGHMFPDDPPHPGPPGDQPSPDAPRRYR